MVVKLLPDPAIGAIKESREAGLVKIKINISKESDKKPIKYNLEDEDVKVTKKPTTTLTNYTIIANIYQSRYLIAGDSDGTSDPYVKIKLNDKVIQTTIKNDTINPVRLNFNLDLE
jgi:Ca2+-dependent lipid-binding protein